MSPCRTKHTFSLHSFHLAMGWSAWNPAVSPGAPISLRGYYPAPTWFSGITGAHTFQSTWRCQAFGQGAPDFSPVPDSPETWGVHACVIQTPRPTLPNSVLRFAGYCSRPGKKKADFWAKLYTSKEAKNLPAACVGSTAGRDSHHPGNRGHHLPRTVLLPPAW